MKSDKKKISKRKKKEEPLILIDKEPNRELDKEYKIRSVDNSTLLH